MQTLISRGGLRARRSTQRSLALDLMPGAAAPSNASGAQTHIIPVISDALFGTRSHTAGARWVLCNCFDVGRLCAHPPVEELEIPTQVSSAAQGPAENRAQNVLRCASACQIVRTCSGGANLLMLFGHRQCGAVNDLSKHYDKTQRGLAALLQRTSGHSCHGSAWRLR